MIILFFVNYLDNYFWIIYKLIYINGKCFKIVKWKCNYCGLVVIFFEYEFIKNVVIYFSIVFVRKFKLVVRLYICIYEFLKKM